MTYLCFNDINGYFINKYVYKINRYLTTEDTEAHRVFKIKIITSVVLCDLCGEQKHNINQF